MIHSKGDSRRKQDGVPVSISIPLKQDGFPGSISIPLKQDGFRTKNCRGTPAEPLASPGRGGPRREADRPTPAELGRSARLARILEALVFGRSVGGRGSCPLWVRLKIQRSEGQTAGFGFPCFHFSTCRSGNPCWNFGFLNSPQPCGPWVGDFSCVLQPSLSKKEKVCSYDRD